MKIRARLKSNILWVIILSFGVFILCQFIKILGDKESRLKIINGIPPEYSGLFQDAKKISDPYSYILYNTNDSSISDFYYDDKYWVVITKLSNKKLDSLPLVTVKKGKLELTEGSVYAGFDEGYFHLDVLPGAHRISNIILTVNGDSLTNILHSNDLIAYRFKFKSMSIGYNDLKTNNLDIEQSLNKTVPSCTVFLKRQQSTYLIFISESNPASTINVFTTFDLNQILRN